MPPRRTVTNADLSDQLDAFRAEYKKSSLNGEAQTLRDLAKVAPQLHSVAEAAPKLAELASRADDLGKLADRAADLIAVVSERQDRASARRWLRRITGWDHGARGIVVFVLSLAVCAAVTLWLTHVTGSTPTSPVTP